MQLMLRYGAKRGILGRTSAHKVTVSQQPHRGVALALRLSRPTGNSNRHRICIREGRHRQPHSSGGHECAKNYQQFRVSCHLSVE